MSTRGAPLVLAAHGTADPQGQAVIAELADLTRAGLPGVEVRLGFVDVISPTLDEVLCPGAVVVPCFLGSGFHVHVDIPASLAAAPGTRATAAFGPAPQIVAAVADRLAEAVTDSAVAHAAVDQDAAIVLGAAGSSDSRSRAETETAAGELSEILSRPVSVGYLSAAPPTVADEVARRRAEGYRRVWVASYLLAPGFFQRRLHHAGADLVSAPIGAHHGVADLIVQRYLAM